jgi:hypothetical protein
MTSGGHKQLSGCHTNQTKTPEMRSKILEINFRTSIRIPHSPTFLDGGSTTDWHLLLCCALLRFAAFCCALLRFAALCCALLRFAALCCALLKCALLRFAAHCCAVLRFAALCCALLRFAALCCALLRFAALCCAVLTVLHCATGLRSAHYCFNAYFYCGCLRSLLKTKFSFWTWRKRFLSLLYFFFISMSC